MGFRCPTTGQRAELAVLGLPYVWEVPDLVQAGPQRDTSTCIHGLTAHYLTPLTHVANETQNLSIQLYWGSASQF